MPHLDALCRSLLFCALAGCGVYVTQADLDAVRDADLDGVPVDADCDDADPEAAAVRDWFVDADGDGYGGSVGDNACNRPLDQVALDGDCDDADADVHPDAPEYCDEVDNDCNTLVDDKPVVLIWYDDIDGDGYGSDASAFETCVPLPVGSDEGGDCDDENPGVHPGALEVCSGLDEDCDGLVDHDDPDMDGDATWYADGDADRYGAGPGTTGCSPPGAGDWAMVDGDCDDSDAAVSPAAPEICDDADNDCDGEVDVLDADLTDGLVFYPDTDGDGFGDDGGPVVACDPPPGHTDATGDCDDGDGAIHPQVSEVWSNNAAQCTDGDDNDCDGAIDATDDDCQDDDADGVVNGIDALYPFDGDANGSAEHLCVRARLVSVAPWVSEDAVAVVDDIGLLPSPEDGLSLSAADGLGAVDAGSWCWDLSGLPASTYVMEYVSVVAADGVSAANEGNCNNWERADVDGYCATTLDPYCGVGLLIDSCGLVSATVRVEWNGSAL